MKKPAPSVDFKCGYLAAMQEVYAFVKMKQKQSMYLSEAEATAIFAVTQDLVSDISVAVKSMFKTESAMATDLGIAATEMFKTKKGRQVK